MEDKLAQFNSQMGEQLLTLSSNMGNLGSEKVARFNIKGNDYDFYTSHYIMWDGKKYIASSKIEKKYGGPTGALIQQWLMFYYYESSGSGMSGDPVDKIGLGDDGYIYYPDVAHKTDYVIALSTIMNMGEIKIKSTGAPATKPGGTITKPVVVGMETGEGVVTGEGAGTKLAGFVTSPIFILVAIGLVGWGIWKFTKGRNE